MANQAVQDISETGLNPAFAAAAAGGDDFVNGERTFLAVKNGLVAVIVTIVVQRINFDIDKFGKVAFASLVINVPASEERWIKVPLAPYTDGFGKVQVTYDDVQNVTVAAVRMPPG